MLPATAPSKKYMRIYRVRFESSLSHKIWKSELNVTAMATKAMIGNYIKRVMRKIVQFYRKTAEPISVTASTYRPFLISNTPQHCRSFSFSSLSREDTLSRSCSAAT